MCNFLFFLLLLSRLALRFFSSLFQIFKLHTYWELSLFLLTWLLFIPKFLAVSLYFSPLSPIVKRKDTDLCFLFPNLKFLAVSLYFSLLSPTVKRKDSWFRRWGTTAQCTPHPYDLFYVFFFFLITKNQIFSKRVKDSFVINKKKTIGLNKRVRFVQ